MQSWHTTSSYHLCATSNRLIEVLGDFGQNDWQLSSLVCKTLWNFSDKLTSSVLCFGTEEADLIAKQLEVYLGEGNIDYYALCTLNYTIVMYVTVLFGLHNVYSTVFAYSTYVCINVYCMYGLYVHIRTHVYFTHATYAHTYMYIRRVVCEYVRMYIYVIFFQMNMLWSLYPAMYPKMPGLTCTVPGRMSSVQLQPLCWTVSNSTTPALCLCSEIASYSPGGCIL